jgi:hypothetical protein
LVDRRCLAGAVAIVFAPSARETGEIESGVEVERFTSYSELDDAQRCRQTRPPAIRDTAAFAPPLA